MMKPWRQPMTDQNDTKPPGWILSNMSDYETRRLHGEPLFSDDGLSPGGVAAKLGISRQAVHDAINRGSMRAIRIDDSQGNLLAIIIPQPEYQNYRIQRNKR
jgi:hypothetical protein